ncbi:hypothetical protein KI743_06660 [Vibrio sp. D420a]|uniref:MBOAT family O-acyltransferase n=1 Tax=Vibrio sp. D420a TaxID=2836895 RepID=UPI0025554159|nr:MBOAT family O-acyltransferase [Vibrio sp. D420a]MDK9761676.1 hypothetical protein [Vibrio sp. D420a]
MIGIALSHGFVLSNEPRVTSRMSFISVIFLIFLPIVFFLYFFSPNRFKPWIILLASYSFYAYWDWRYTPLMFFSSIVDYYCGKLMWRERDRGRRKVYLYISLLVNLGILVSFKYWNFIGSNMNDILGSDFQAHNLLLPLGISFYTLQSLSYTFDVYLGKVKPEDKLSNFCLFVSFFPQLVAGPIERSRNLIPQLKSLSSPSENQFFNGFFLILWGVFLKVVIADNLTGIITSVYFNDVVFPFWLYWIVGSLTLIKIYCDFMAYSEIARGVAKLFGVEITVNFRRPLFAKTLKEFWQRWHISLTRWIGDYVFKPLALRNKSDGARNLITVFTLLLIGFWHGASWNFIIFGLIQGIIIVSWNPISNFFTSNIFFINRYKKIIGMSMVFVCMSFSSTIFYVSDMEVLLRVMERMFDLTTISKQGGLSVIHGKIDLIFALIGAFVLGQFSYWAEFKKVSVVDVLVESHPIYYWMASMLLLFTMMFFGSFSSEVFIYFAF